MTLHIIRTKKILISVCRSRMVSRSGHPVVHSESPASISTSQMAEAYSFLCGVPGCHMLRPHVFHELGEKISTSFFWVNEEEILENITLPFIFNYILLDFQTKT